MTPTSTGRRPAGEPTEAGPSRTRTVAYFRGRTPSWIGEQARPAGAERLRPGESTEVEISLLELAEAAATGHPLTTRDTRRLGEAVAQLSGRVERLIGAARATNHQASEALDRAEDAETRLELAQRRILQLEDRADDEDTVVVDVDASPIHPDCAAWVAGYVKLARSLCNGEAIGPSGALAILADLVEAWLTAARNLDDAERRAPARVPHRLYVAVDDAERALARAVRR